MNNEFRMAVRVYRMDFDYRIYSCVLSCRGCGRMVPIWDVVAYVAGGGYCGKCAGIATWRRVDGDLVEFMEKWVCSSPDAYQRAIRGEYASVQWHHGGDCGFAYHIASRRAIRAIRVATRRDYWEELK